MKSCFACKRFKVMRYPNPKLGLLARDRTEEALPSEIVGTDYMR